MYGKVTRYFKDRGYGFIYGEDCNTYFIHHSNLRGEHIERGYYVHFTAFQNDRSDYNAKYVSVVGVPEKRVDVKGRKKRNRGR